MLLTPLAPCTHLSRRGLPNVVLFRIEMPISLQSDLIRAGLASRS